MLRVMLALAGLIEMYYLFDVSGSVSLAEDLKGLPDLENFQDMTLEAQDRILGILIRSLLRFPFVAFQFLAMVAGMILLPSPRCWATAALLALWGISCKAYWKVPRAARWYLTALNHIAGVAILLLWSLLAK